MHTLRSCLTASTVLQLVLSCNQSVLTKDLHVFVFRKIPCTCVAGVNFQYRDPERGFDRGKVKGVVAKLVRLQDPATTTALEVAAGGKLYQVN